MTTTTTTSASTAIAVPEPVFSAQERLALAGFLAGYTGLTREAYALDRASSPPGANYADVGIIGITPTLGLCRLGGGSRWWWPWRSWEGGHNQRASRKARSWPGGR